MLQELIQKQLMQIEKNNEVQILYACETGSRAWGVPSPPSDYDVRFIYIHRIEWYVSITDKRDVIELPADALLDINGWELRKALRLLRKSNPSLLEWLSSQIKYRCNEKFFEQLWKISEAVFSPRTCCHHYLQMAKRNQCQFLRKKEVQIKKYFYVLRPLFACKWMEAYRTFPPMLFQYVLKQLLEPSSLKQEINQLINWKIIGKETARHTDFPLIDEFINSELQRLSVVVAQMKHQPSDRTNDLDTLFRQTLADVWKKPIK